MASYLITGGTGLIGQALIAELMQSPVNLYVLTRNKKAASQKLGYAVHVIESLQEIGDDVDIDYVINLAGEPIADKRWSTRQKLQIWQSRIELTQNLYLWMKQKKRPPKLLISGSAVGWYGDRGQREITEADSAHSEYTHKLCDAWEQKAWQASKLGCRVCLIRTGLVISGQGGFLSKLILPFKLGLGARLGDGQQYMPWIHIDDVVGSVLFLIKLNQYDQDNSGVYNLTAPHPVTNKEFTQCLAAVLHRKAWLFIPAFLLKLMLGEMSRLLLCGQRAIPARLTELGFKFKFSTLDKALEDVLIS